MKRVRAISFVAMTTVELNSQLSLKSNQSELLEMMSSCFNQGNKWNELWILIANQTFAVLQFLQYKDIEHNPCFKNIISVCLMKPIRAFTDV